MQNAFEGGDEVACIDGFRRGCEAMMDLGRQVRTEQLIRDCSASLAYFKDFREMAVRAVRATPQVPYAQIYRVLVKRPKSWVTVLLRHHGRRPNIGLEEKFRPGSQVPTGAVYLSLVPRPVMCLFRSWFRVFAQK